MTDSTYTVNLNNMNENNWGGARKGAGRPAHGKTSKYMTLTLTIEQADQLKAMAAEADLTISQYIVEKCGLVGGPKRKASEAPAAECKDEKPNIFRVSFEDMGMLRAAEMDNSSYKTEKDK